MKLRVQGIEIELTRKKVKNINLSVRPDGRVQVSAPNAVPLERIESFVASKYAWIRAHLDTLPTSSESELCDGTEIFVFGCPYSLRFEEKAGKNVHISGEELVVPLSVGAPREKKEALIDDFLRQELKGEISFLLPIWQERTGLFASSWSIRKMKTRWGSCNSTSGSIHFALELANKPPECIEYVILHELAHLKEANHSDRFKAILDEYMPDWRELKQRLNRREGSK